MQIKEAIQDYLAMRKAEGLAQASVDAFADRLKRLQKFLSKNAVREIQRVKPEHLDGFVLELVGKGSTHDSRYTYISTARCFFAWLTKCGKVLSNPARDTVLPDVGEEPLPPPPLTEAEVSKIIDGIPRRSVSDIRNRLHLELLYSCGLRIAESQTLKISDIDLETKTLRVLGKNGKVRSLPLMKGVVGALKDYLAVRRSLLKSPDVGFLLIADRTGSQIKGNAFGNWLRGWCKKLRIKRRVFPHLLRHSIAVHLLQRGSDIRYVQSFLGHESLDTTKIYLRMVTGRLKEDYEKAMPEIALHGLRKQGS